MQQLRPELGSTRRKLAVVLGRQQQQDLAVALVVVLWKQQAFRLLEMLQRRCLPLSLPAPLGQQAWQIPLVLLGLPAHQPGQSGLLLKVVAVQQPLVVMAALLVLGVWRLH